MTGDDYYAMISGSDTVYTVGGSVIEALNYSLEDIEFGSRLLFSLLLLKQNISI